MKIYSMITYYWKYYLLSVKMCFVFVSGFLISSVWRYWVSVCWVTACFLKGKAASWDRGLLGYCCWEALSKLSWVTCNDQNLKLPGTFIPSGTSRLPLSSHLTALPALKSPLPGWMLKHNQNVVFSYNNTHNSFLQVKIFANGISDFPDQKIR